MDEAQGLEIMASPSKPCPCGLPSALASGMCGWGQGQHVARRTLRWKQGGCRDQHWLDLKTSQPYVQEAIPFGVRW